MLDKIESAKKKFEVKIESVKDIIKLEEVRIEFLGRKGLFAELFEEFKKLSKVDKPKFGQVLNRAKNSVQNKFEELKSKIEKLDTQKEEYIDLTLPARNIELGSKHILTKTMDEIKQIFKGLGFSIYEGPELESDHNNFEMLNFPADHPARDMQDTFFINDNFLLRTHTSPVQVRLMENKKPPIRALMPGKVYRNEAISAKSYCLFHQVEGLYVDENVTFAELKGTLVAFLKQFFGEVVQYRFRPSYFPFTEPSAEVDVWWQPKGKEGRWLEILGCGMVDPNVLENVKIDNEKYVGYALGMGVERIAMLKYGVSDIRVFFDNDKRFLEQF